MSTKLSVNVNSVAYLRNRRNLPWPDLLAICRVALDAGAAGITVHPRPDQRHIRTQDVHEISAMLAADYPGKEFNMEGYPSEEFLRLVEQVRPDQATLVPDHPDQKTSDHGWDLENDARLVRRSVERLRDAGCRVSLFLDADVELVPLAAGTGADRIELYTGPYGGCSEPVARARLLEALAATVEAAVAAGMGVNAGHDLTLDNLGDLLTRAPMVAEVSIGHGLTADALLYGYGDAVSRYAAICGVEG